MELCSTVILTARCLIFLPYVIAVQIIYVVKSVPVLTNCYADFITVSYGLLKLTHSVLSVYHKSFHRLVILFTWRQFMMQFLELSHMIHLYSSPCTVASSFSTWNPERTASFVVDGLPCADILHWTFILVTSNLSFQAVYFMLYWFNDAD
jgi:hypothetical protein